MSRASTRDMYAAIDALADKLDRQVVKYKEKLTDHRGDPAAIPRAAPAAARRPRQLIFLEQTPVDSRHRRGACRARPAGARAIGGSSGRLPVGRYRD